MFMIILILQGLWIDGGLFEITDYGDAGEATVVDTLSNKVYKVCLECGEDLLIDLSDIH